MAWQYRGANALEGASTGAAMGGTVGSIIPGVGTGVGAAVGGALGALWGLLSSTEQQELADRMARGEIDPEQEAAIAQALGRRYEAMQVRYGTDMARRGLTDSTIAARMQGNLMAQEGEDLALALGQVSQQNKQIGHDMQAQQSAARTQAFGQAAGTLGNLYLSNRQTDLDKEWMALYGKSLERPNVVSQSPTSGRVGGRPNVPPIRSPIMDKKPIGGGGKVPPIRSPIMESPLNRQRMPVMDRGGATSMTTSGRPMSFNM